MRFIREGFEKRVSRDKSVNMLTCWYDVTASAQLYVEAADGNLEPESEVCACKPATTTGKEEEEPELVCAVISPVPERPCNTRDVFYR